MSWRPDDWHNPYPNTRNWKVERRIFEAGADAMLEAIIKVLRENSHYYMASLLSLKNNY